MDVKRTLKELASHKSPMEGLSARLMAYFTIHYQQVQDD